jgi:hypothetical protein
VCTENLIRVDFRELTPRTLGRLHHHFPYLPASKVGCHDLENAWDFALRGLAGVAGERAGQR